MSGASSPVGSFGTQTSPAQSSRKAGKPDAVYPPGRAAGRSLSSIALLAVIVVVAVAAVAWVVAGAVFAILRVLELLVVAGLAGWVGYRWGHYRGRRRGP